MCVNVAFNNSPAIKDAKVTVLSLHSCTILPYASRVAARTTGAPFEGIPSRDSTEMSVSLQRTAMPECHAHQLSEAGESSHAASTIQACPKSSTFLWLDLSTYLNFCDNPGHSPRHSLRTDGNSSLGFRRLMHSHLPTRNLQRLAHRRKRGARVRGCRLAAAAADSVAARRRCRRVGGVVASSSTSSTAADLQAHTSVMT